MSDTIASKKDTESFPLVLAMWDVRSRPYFKHGSPNPFTCHQTLNHQTFDVVTWRGYVQVTTWFLFHPTRPKTSLTRTNQNRQLAIVHVFQQLSKKQKQKRPDFFTSILGFPIHKMWVAPCSMEVMGHAHTHTHTHTHTHDHPRDHPGKYLYYAGTFWLYL